ncbi:MAG: DUF975 family protein [Candidatus Nomurabacteria bacterium]|jgi:uncharacterized membrane protein|nr:DUF975 family protein [Candidatus Nomurabacteria bacterium]
MNRKQIKAEAKAKLKGNWWTLFKPILLVAVIEFALVGILSFIFKVDWTARERHGAGYQTVNILNALAVLPLSVGMITYYLKFLRGKKAELADLFGSYKDILTIVIIAIIVCALTFLGTLLLVIPGIIIGLGLAMVYYLVSDGETSSTKAISKSWEMMKGHKWEYFVFCLSFLGWILLGVVTLGIAMLWVTPYMYLAQANFYDHLLGKKTKATEKKAEAKPKTK